MNSFLWTNKLPLILMVVCLPLALKKIGRNGLYGFRTPRAMESDESWYRINQVGGSAVITMMLAAMAVKPWCPADLAGLIDAVFFGVAVAMTLAWTALRR